MIIARRPKELLPFLITTGLVLAGCAPQPRGKVAVGSSASEGSQYTVSFGDAEPTGVIGSYTIPLQTNLPDGTAVFTEYESKYLGSSGTGASVAQGNLQLTLLNSACVDEGGVLVSPPTSITVIVARDYLQFAYGLHHGLATPQSAQPPKVLAVLGPELEHLQGPEVRVVDGMNVLIATHEYQLPADTCTAKFIPGPNNDYGQQVPVSPSPG